MRLIIGLGNPSNEYKNNRHNAGYIAIDEIKSIKSKGFGKYLALKTNTFMNDSGEFVMEAVRKYKVNLNDLYIIHDDLDIKLGEYKIQFAKGPKDNNGLNDIYEKLGSKEFWHVRIGVDNRETDNRVDGKTYVLEDFSHGEKDMLLKTIKEICKKLEI